jgi:Protein of unknown function (DUF1579)
MTMNDGNQTPQQPPKPGPEHKLLDVFIGKWITEGQTIASAGAPPVKILASDVYEWMPGGFFVLHTAYGRIDSMDVGGTEILSYDAASKKYRSHFFDGQGTVSVHELTLHDGVWTWTGGEWAAEKHRATAVFSDDGKTQTAHHERSDDGVNWVPSMDVKLVKVE